MRSFSGAALESWRRRRALSHDALAAVLGISRPNLIAYEKGRRRPAPATAVALAEALGIPPARLAAVPVGSWVLADLRAFSGWTKAEMAEAIGIPRATYDAMERGRRRFHTDQLERVAAVLNRPVGAVRAAYRRSLTAG